MKVDMDWALILTVVGTGASVVGLIYGFLRNLKSDIDLRLDKIDKEWKEESKKMDQRVTDANRRMDGVYHILLKKVE